MAKKRKLPSHFANTGTEEIPPGATAKAADRPTNPGGGPPGSGGGERHAVGEPGGGNVDSGLVDNPDTDPTRPAEADAEDQDTAGYGGPSGGAVGGTPAEGRSSGGRTGRGLSPGGVHRGDSTIGADPDSDAE